MGVLIKTRYLLWRIGLPVDKKISLTTLHCGLEVGISFDVLNSHPMVDTLTLSKGSGGRNVHNQQSGKVRRNRVVG